MSHIRNSKVIGYVLDATASGAQLASDTIGTISSRAKGLNRTSTHCGCLKCVKLYLSHFNPHTFRLPNYEKELAVIVKKLGTPDGKSELTLLCQNPGHNLRPVIKRNIHDTISYNTML